MSFTPVVRRFFVFFSAFSLSNAAHAEPVTWEQQAERLQNVNATFLDAFPMGEPLQVTRSVEFKSIISVLPKPNSKIGGKIEKAPTAPIHSLPTLQYNQVTSTQGLWKIGVQGWVGLLPKGAEKLIGLKVSLMQWAIGGAMNAVYESGAFHFYAPIGIQYSSAKATGPITDPSAKDSFSTKTLLFYAAPGVKYPEYSVWANALIGLKQTRSIFTIPSDKTKFEIDDYLDDSFFPLAMQLSVGWYHPLGIQLGIGQLIVPKRLAMPRLLASYQFAF